MVFSTVTFLFYFLPIFLVLYFALPFRHMRNIVLLVASLIFYAWGEPKNLPLLLISILLNYLCGLGMGKAQEKGSTGKAIFMAGIGFNLLLLTYFKYFNFALGSVVAVLGKAGINMPEVEAVTLPLGISFFSFHAISYLVDVYRKKTAHEKNLFALAMYITMFPAIDCRAYHSFFYHCQAIAPTPAYLAQGGVGLQDFHSWPGAKSVDCQ